MAISYGSREIGKHVPVSKDYVLRPDETIEMVFKTSSLIPDVIEEPLVTELLKLKARIQGVEVIWIDFDNKKQEVKMQVKSNKKIGGVGIVIMITISAIAIVIAAIAVVVGVYLLYSGSDKIIKYFLPSIPPEIRSNISKIIAVVIIGIIMSKILGISLPVLKRGVLK